MPIHDRVYRRLDPAPERPHRFPARVIGRYSLKYSVRGWFTRVVLAAGCIPTIIFCGIVYFASQSENGAGILALVAQATPNAQQSLDGLTGGLSSVSDEAWRQMGEVGTFMLLSWQIWVLIILTPLLGARSIADDLRTQAFEVYLARPIRGFDYLLGKLLGVVQPLWALAVVPSCIVLALTQGLIPEAAGALWPLYGKVLIVGTTLAMINASIVLGISSLGPSRRYGTVLWYLLSFGSSMLQASLFQGTRDRTFDFVGFPTNQQLFALGVVDAQLPEAIADGFEFVSHDPSPWRHFGVLAVLTAVSWFLVMRRVRAGRRP